MKIENINKLDIKEQLKLVANKSITNSEEINAIVENFDRNLNKFSDRRSHEKYTEELKDFLKNENIPEEALSKIADMCLKNEISDYYSSLEKELYKHQNFSEDKTIEIIKSEHYHNIENRFNITDNVANEILKMDKGEYIEGLASSNQLKDLSVEIQLKLVEQENYKINSSIAIHTESPEVLKSLAEANDFFDKPSHRNTTLNNIIINNKNATEDVYKIISDKDVDIKNIIKKTESPELLSKIIEQQKSEKENFFRDSHINSRVTNFKFTSEEIFNNNAVIDSLLENKNTPESFIKDTLENSIDQKSLSLALKHPNVSTELLEEFSKKTSNQSKETIEAIINNPKTTEKALQILADNEASKENRMGRAVELAIANKHLDDITFKGLNSNQKEFIAERTTNQQTLDSLSSEKSDKIREAVSRNENTSDITLQKMFQDSNFYVKDNISRHPNASGGTLELLSFDNNSTIRTTIANSDKLSSFALERMSFDDNENVRNAAIRNDNFPPEALDRIVSNANRDDEVLRQVSANSSASSDTLDKIVEKTDDSIANRNIALHPNVSEETLNKIINKDNFGGAEKELAIQPKLSDEQKEKLLNTENVSTLSRLAQVANSSDLADKAIEKMIDIAEHNPKERALSSEFRNIVSNQNLSDDSLQKITEYTKSGYPSSNEVFEKIKNHENASNETLMKIIDKSTSDYYNANPKLAKEVFDKVVCSSNLTEEQANKLASIKMDNRIVLDKSELINREDTSSKTLLIILEKDPNYSNRANASERLEEIGKNSQQNSNNNSDSILLSISKDAETSASTLDKISNSADKEILKAVISNDNVSNETLMKLAEHSNKEVSEASLDKLESRVELSKQIESDSNKSTDSEKTSEKSEDKQADVEKQSSGSKMKM